MKRSLMAMILIGQLGQAAVADPEPPAWAEDAVKTVEQKGIMQGYPNGDIGGDRPVKRDELAELLERLDQERIQNESQFAPESEVTSTQQDATSLREEMEAMQTRVDNLENNTDQMEQRRDHLGRPSL